MTDLGSTNGTKVNGRKISAVDLVDGDLIEAGKTVLLFSMTDEEATTTPVRETKPSRSDATSKALRSLLPHWMTTGRPRFDGDRRKSGVGNVPSATVFAR